MPDPIPHQDHTHIHAPVAVAPSLLRLSALQRIAIAAALALILWGSVIWALAGVAQ